MPSLTIRIRTPKDEAAIEALKAATRERTAAGALMRAARSPFRRRTVSLFDPTEFCASLERAAARLA